MVNNKKISKKKINVVRQVGSALSKIKLKKRSRVSVVIPIDEKPRPYFKKIKL